MKKYIVLSLLLIVTCVLFGQEEIVKKKYVPEPPPVWIKESRKAAESNYIETFADAFNDPNILIGVFEWPTRIPHRTRLSTGEILEDMPGYHEATIRFSLTKLHCFKPIKGKPPEPVVLVTTLPPPMLEGTLSIPEFIPLLGSKWVLALKKTSKEYRISRFGGEDVEKYKFINDRTTFSVFRYGHGALCLKWSDYKKMLPKLPEPRKPSHLIEVTESIVEDFNDIQQIIPIMQKEKINPNELASITNTSKALKTDAAKSIFAEVLRGKSGKVQDPNDV